MSVSRPTFATFWAGSALSPYEAACLHSFAARGFDVAVYGYAPLAGIPPSVQFRDASEIAPAETMTRFIYNGRPDLAHFSDYFRYRLFSRTEAIWIDADLLLLADMSEFAGRELLARETRDSLNGAIMRLDGKRPELAQLLAKTEALMDREMQWGETGPKLVSEVFQGTEVLRNAFAPGRFFPVSHDDAWKPFLPECREECERLCKNSYTLHLWNNIVSRMGIWKVTAPPKGSFLARRFEDDGSFSFFKEHYPAEVMRQMMANWRLRKSGGDLGFVGVSRQLLPSVLRTARHHFGDRAFAKIPFGKRVSC